MFFSTFKLINRRAFISTSESDDEIVVEKAGRVHFFAFNNKNTCVGMFVKRPDVALMFRRKDLFAPLSCCDFVNEGVIISNDYKKKTEKLRKEEGLDLDCTFVLDGTDVVTESGENLGVVEELICDSKSGKVEKFVVSDGGLSDTLLGKRTLSGDVIVGLRAESSQFAIMKTESKDDLSGPVLVVKDSAKQTEHEGGVAKKTAVASVKAKKKAIEAKDVIKEKATPGAKAAKEKASTLAEKGKDSFSETFQSTKDGVVGFRDEFLKAFRSEDEAEEEASSSDEGKE